MSRTTPNLGLHKYDPATDGNLTFNINTAINGPFDIIDDKLGGQIVSAASIAKIIPQGANIVNADRKSMFRSISFTGRTLVNVTGRIGNCEDLSKFGTYQVTVALDATNKTVGNNGLKVTMNTNSAFGGSAFIENITFKAGKYYIAIADIKNGTSPDGVRLGLSGGATANSNHVTDTTKFNTAYFKYNPIFDNTTNVDLAVLGNTTGQFGYFDAVRVYEISQAEYNAIDSMTAAQVATKYPYVDDMKHVNAVHVMNPGKNLLPPFSEWTSPAVIPTIVGAYKSVVNKATETPDYSHVIVVPVIGGQTYSFSADITVSNIGGTIGVGAYYNLTPIAADGSTLTSLNTPPYATSNGTTTIGKTVTLPSNAVAMRVVLGVDTATGTFTYTNPMFNIGSTALPFEPQKPSYMFLPDPQARSNVDRSVEDQFYMDGNGKPRIVRRFREMVLDGSLPWVFDFTATGLKVIRFAHSDAPIGRSGMQAVKYDGKPIVSSPGASTAIDLLDYSGGFVYISVSDTDSGWGESYTPTADEIKAYFNGWKMFIHGGSPAVPYNGIGDKSWVRLMEGDQATPINVPTSFAGGNYTPYRLMYQLAQSIDEPVAHEGTLMLHDGPNQVEMGTGIVVREETTPKLRDDGFYAINYQGGNSSGHHKLKYRSRLISKVFRNQVRDSWTYFNSPAAAYGNDFMLISVSGYDQTKPYSVTYLALDTYKIGIAPLSISGFVSPNIKEQVDDAAEAIAGLQRDVSVLQATKAGKQQPQRIAPTLLNGWVNEQNGFSTAAYYKDDTGFVRFAGLIKNGAVGSSTALFILPVGYRPSASQYIATLSNSASGAVPIIIEITTLGIVRIGAFSSGNVWLALDGISFRVS